MVNIINLDDYGWEKPSPPAAAGFLPARVTAVHKERYELICEYGQAFGRLKTAVYYGREEEFPTVGDFVLLQYEPLGDSQIVKTLPRRSFFSRRDPSPGRGEQAVAANFDTVFVMTSLNKDFNVSRLERYLALAWQSGGTPVVILTKSDLAEGVTVQEKAEIAETAFPGVDIIAVSAVTGQGLEKLSVYLRPKKTAVFLGSSGVGKSSLLNALAGEELMDVKAIREDDSRGRHTTTHRQLFMLPSGGMIIDTPGMRELGMWEVSHGLGAAFADIEEVLSRPCRFSDCRHQTEPGCAVKTAIENGELTAERWNSYLNLKRESRFSDDKIAFLRKKQLRHKTLAKWSKQKKKNGEIRK